MKIAFFVDRFPLVSETFVLAQIVGMIRRGHDVTIFANKVLDPAVRHPAIDRYDLLDKTIERPFVSRGIANRLRQGIPALAARMAAGQSGTALRLLNVFRLGRSGLGMNLLIRADAHLGNSKFDVLHSQFGQLGIEVAQLRESGALQGVLVTSFRGTDAMKFASNNPGQFRHLFKAGDRFLAVSVAVRDRLVEIGCPAGKIEIHRSGVDLSAFGYREPGQLHSPIRLVTIGRLSPNKGVEYALEAVYKLLRVGHSIDYRIVGDGPSRQSLTSCVARLGVEATVKFDGAVTADRVAEILGDADVLIAPSITGPHGEQEGLPNSLKEAMACGVLVIGTSIGGIPELIDHGINGFLVPERNADRIADCVKTIIEDRDKMPVIVARARESIESRFDLNRLNADLEQAYIQAGSTS